MGSEISYNSADVRFALGFLTYSIYKKCAIVFCIAAEFFFHSYCSEAEYVGLSEIGAEGQKVKKSKLITFFYCKIEFNVGLFSCIF